LLLSAATPEALATQATRLAPHLDAHPLADIAHTLTTRPALEHRLAVIADDTAGAAATLRTRRGPRGRAAQGGTAFGFSGQGAQPPGMGAGLYARFPVYAAAFDEVCARLHPGLRDRVLGGDPLDDTFHAQTGLFALQVALVRLLASFGVTPQA